MENSIKKNGVTLGIIIGVILVLITTTMYVVDLSLFTNWWIGIVNFVIIIGIAIYSSISSKKELKGIMNYRDAFLSFILPIIVGVAIYVLYNIILFNVIDPDAKMVLTENIIAMTKETMAKFNVPASEINKAISDIESKDNFGPMVQFQSYFFQIAFYAVLGLLVALVFKTPTTFKE
ncbi:DUF4199 domain-containing protein [Flavobacterium sp.]|uniref:DUF4199 domain-containing protein n=1 Tax=Flavobacterium sp. TaxID=239 RepID=UPI00262FBA68|nr:DUF4199 domain-containing protein [Flavobacterium sp.]MDD2986620.1 DUF4199 domain-containing protein [Flavobacterium sp.]